MRTIQTIPVPVRAVCVLTAALASTWVPLSFAEDNSTNFLYNDGATHFVAGDVTVGISGTNNYGEVSNASILTNSGNGQISYGGAAMHNLAVVSGAGSAWNPRDYMIVGFFGSDARLVITNSGSVSSPAGGIIGYYYPWVTNNSVLVTGTGANWSMGGFLWVGGNGADNQLIIEGGATVTNTGSTSIGVGASSSNNFMSVTGGGSLFFNGGDFILSGGGANTLVLNDGGTLISPNIRLGYASAGNQLLITNGGFARVIGTALGEFGANNSALVSGSSSILTNSGVVTVGGSGANNQLTVNDGGKVYSGGASIGASGNGNSALITGSGSLWRNTAGDFNIGLGSSNKLVIENGGSVISPNFQIGAGSGGNNQLIITNGGYAQTIGVTLGTSSSGTGNNLIQVSGAGSVYSNTSLAVIGLGSSNNTVLVSDGGKFYTKGAQTFVGGYFGSFGAFNNIQVTGSNSLWDTTSPNTNSLYFGYTGDRNSLTISDGGRVDVDYFYNLTSSNTVTVAGNGSLLNAVFALFPNFGARENQLIVTNGGKAIAPATILGYSGGEDGLIRVTGTDSVLSNTASGLIIGNSGAGNQLRVEDGGKVYNPAGSPVIIGNGSTASNNYVLVTGSGSLLSTPYEFSLGSGAGGNTMVVADTGRVDVGISLFVGVLSPRNNLIITNGGQVFSAQGVIGYLNAPYDGNFNSVHVTGSGSVWSNSTYPIYVGLNGSSNRLVVSDGGKVYTPITYVSYGIPSTNNTIVITGNGSLLQNDSIHVGNLTGPTSGQDARVLVADGGTLDTPYMASGISGSGSISNRGGIYQFPTATPTVFAGTAGQIAISNGTISYRGVANADIFNAAVGTMSKTGNNAFRLNNSTNVNPVSYKFDSVAFTGDPTNYQRLVLMNNSRWVSDYLTNGIGGAIKGGAGDVVQVTRDFIIQRSSNPNAEFDLASSEVTFTGMTGHTNAITGKDFGNDGTMGFADGFTAQNFSYGKLSLGSSTDTICFESGDNAASNALYVTWLDLMSMTNLVANLHAPTNINLYYFSGNPNNAYLGNNVYQLTDCDGFTTGGLLMPAVPEPSATLLILLAGIASITLRRKAAK